MNNHGGVHEWDLTVSDVHTAIFVRSQIFFIGFDIKMANSFVEVVQHHIGGICADYSMHKDIASAAISSSLFATALEYIRYLDSIVYARSMSVLYRNDYCQDLGVYSKRTNLEQIHSRNLC